MASFNKKNMPNIMCNHKKGGVKKLNYAIVFARTKIKIIGLHKYPIDLKLIWSSG